VVSVLLSARLQASITRPIIQISSLAREVVDKRDYSLRAKRTTDDEIGTLADAFNEMLSEIQRRTSAVRESEAALRRAQSLAKLAHVVTDSQGTFERWSETLPQLLGRNDRDMPRDTRAWLDVVHPEDRNLFRSRAIEAGRADRRTVVEYRLLRADASCVHVLQVMEPIDDPGGPRHWFNTLQDVTEQKTAEEEVRRLNADLEKRVARRTAQLEESNLQLRSATLAKSNFLSMMSHEIRTPMNGALGMLELLSLTDLDPQQRTTLGIVRDSGRSLLRIIDDILDFSKIEAGKLEIRPEIASVARVVAGVAGIYAGNASSKALTLKSHVDPRISPAVVVDPLRLQQILNNLMSNAIKFTSKGSVEIRAEQVERKEGVDVVRFSVIDTGIGISAEGQAALFQPFAQAGSGIARTFGGTGLGLSIGQRLARLMGGAIEIASELGKGTTMSLTLPMPIADPASLPEPEGEKARDVVAETVLARRKPPTVEEAEKEGTLVLVVDDHPINRMVLLRQVGMLGYASEEADDGRKALEKWKSGRFGLVITDCNMPEMDGYELARTIRVIEQAEGRAHTLIIACTANALRGEAENCFAAGMDDYVAKPVEIATLMTKLEQWLPLPGRAQDSPRGPRASRAPAAPVESAAPPVDRAIIAEVSGGDAALERDVFMQFLRANQHDAAVLTRALKARDFAAITQAAHRIKGASRTVGAMQLGEACARLEAAARASDWHAVNASLEAFRREMTRLDAYLEALIAPAR
jgi:PAS domain S-box-containing protein